VCEAAEWPSRFKALVVARERVLDFFAVDFFAGALRAAFFVADFFVADFLVRDRDFDADDLEASLVVDAALLPPSTG